MQEVSNMNLQEKLERLEVLINRAFTYIYNGESVPKNITREIKEISDYL